MSEFISYSEVSKLTSIPLGTLYSYVYKNKIPHYRIGKRLVRFSRREILEWLQESQVRVKNS